VRKLVPFIFRSSRVLGALSRAQIERLGKLITTAEMHAMRVIWAGRLSSDTNIEEESDPNTLVQLASPNLVSKFLEGTMGVQDEMDMGTEALYKAMDGDVDRSGYFIGLKNMNYATPENGWYAYELANPDSNQADAGIRMSFKSQIEVNRSIKEGSPISDPNFIQLRLRWHQLACIHRLLTHISTPISENEELPNIEWSSAIPSEDRRHRREGILIADEVGIGKSAQVLGFIAQVIFWKELEIQGKAFPAVHG
jgi:hypothetical protein